MKRAMPRFHFRVTDVEGKPRRGTMEAPSMADARALIQKRGFFVLELKEAEGPEGSLQVHTTRSTARFRTGPADARPYKMSLAERMAALVPSANTARLVLALLAAVGLVWMVVGWRTGAGKSRSQAGPTSKPAPLQTYKIVVGGRVSVQGSAALGDVQVLVNLPDIPYQQTFEWAKLKHPVSNGFVAELQFQTARRAKTMIVKVRKPGLGEDAAPEIRLRPDGGVFDQLQFNVRPKAR